MKAATLSEIKKDLYNLPPREAADLCLRLAKFKKENKELLTYLLYESTDEETYKTQIKDEMDVLFGEINDSNMYYAKKGFRKILRLVNKFIKYSDIKSTEIELLIYYCKKLKQSKISIYKSQQMVNLYERQLQRMNKALATLHEDLQYDYEQEIQELNK
jgi:hypothetical protein